MDTIQHQATTTTVLFILGGLIKHVVPSESINRYIPVILCAIGTPLFCALAQEWSMPLLVQGLICSFSATGIHQIAKQHISEKI